jgi:phospholipid/cholesterol/gamma-HCH transport system permease protein
MTPNIATTRDTRSRLLGMVGGPGRVLAEMGRQASFYGRALGYLHLAGVRYRREVLRLIAEMSLGTGALAVIGGTLVVTAFLTFSVGGIIGVQGYNNLKDIGVQVLSGFFAAFVEIRISGPTIAGFGLVATIGAGATAQIGAMRISEEIDALEVMSVRSLPFLVTTRLIAGFIVTIPLYAAAIIVAFFASKLVVVYLYGQSAGAYQHYFSTFLIRTDILNSFGLALAISTVVMLIHCYYGYTATGGPAGVGVAVGRAVRASLVAVVSIALLGSLLLYGSTDTFNFSG